MSENKIIKFYELRILIVIPLVMGLFSIWFQNNSIRIEKAIPLGIATIKAKIDAAGNCSKVQITNHCPLSPSKLEINTATILQLQSCPGIRKKVAVQIVEERKLKRFFDWRDLKDRIKGIGDKQIELLKDAGVKLVLNEK